MVATPAKPEEKRRRREAARLGHLLQTPNLLTLCRIVSIPFFLVLVNERRFEGALYLFTAAALTDALDGTVARWSNSRTELGAFLDPFADKLLLVSSFIALTFEQMLPLWLLDVVIIRDVVIVFGYFMLSFFTGERIPVRPSYLGKASTFLQLACVLAALLHWDLIQPISWEALLYATLVATGLSGLHYMYRGLIWLSSREPEMFA
jgi:cardiolipin synthase (CMP-forming)